MQCGTGIACPALSKSDYCAGVSAAGASAAVASAARKLWTVDKEEDIRAVLDIKTGKLTAYAGDEEMTEDLKDTIKRNAEGPRRAAGDAGSVDQHSLKDQIEADKYLAGKEAASKNPAKAFTRVKIVPPGSV